jgi:hypothetical protein
MAVETPSAAAPPPVAPQAEPDVPRSLGGRSMDARIALAGSAGASLALVWVLYEQILPWSGTLGFLVCWYAVFLALYAGVTWIVDPRTEVVERLAEAVVTGAAVLVGGALVSTVTYTIAEGWPALVHLAGDAVCLDDPPDYQVHRTLLVGVHHVDADAAAADACCAYGRYHVSGGSPGSRASETLPTTPTTVSQGVFGRAMRRRLPSGS